MKRTKIIPFIILISLLNLSISVNSSASLAWASDGVEICTANDIQEFSQIVSDGMGGAIIVWADHRNSETSCDIYGQRIDANGNVLWNPNGTIVCVSNESQRFPLIVSDGMGGAIIIWENYKGETFSYDICAQRIDANGNVLWNPNGTVICTTHSFSYSYRLISDSTGGAIIIWIDDRGTTEYDIYAQRIDANGNKLWTQNGTAICTADLHQQNLEVTSDSAGGAIIVWEDARNWGVNLVDIYAQRIDASGNTLWTPNGTAICTTSDNQNLPQIISDGLAGAILVWEDYRGVSKYDIYAQQINADGNTTWTPNGTVICSASENQRYPKIVSDTGGGAIVVWEDGRDELTTDIDIYSQRIDLSGNIKWDVNGEPICTTDNYQGFHKIVSDGTGGAFIVWSDSRNGVDPDIYAQQIGSNGNIKWSKDGIAICTENNSQGPPEIARDGEDGAIIVWEDFRSGSDLIYSDIYAQKIFDYDTQGISFGSYYLLLIVFSVILIIVGFRQKLVKIKNSENML